MGPGGIVKREQMYQRERERRGETINKGEVKSKKRERRRHSEINGGGSTP